LGKTLNVVSHLGAKQSPILVAKPDERHANGTAFVLEWYDTEEIPSGSNEEGHPTYLLHGNNSVTSK